VAGEEIGVGAFLPTFLLQDGPPRRQVLLDFARETESLGFDSLWVTDHLLRATRFYQAPWLEPLSVLSFVTGITKRVRLGTGILILPLRDPVLLAKEICTLQDLSDGRFILGAGTGWFEDEFAAVGRSKRHRGRLTDEVLDLLELLMTRESVTYQGQHFHVDDVSIEPRPSVRPPFWIAGGSQFPHAASPETPVLAEPVLRRIQRGDGWVTRPTALPEQIREDWARIEPTISARERGPDGFVVAHENFVHVVETDDREKALEAQRTAYTALMGTERPFEYFEAVYLTGTPPEIVDRLVARIEAGVDYVMLHPLVADPSQLELWWDLIVGPLRDRAGKLVSR
jgi:probable F420-dependent oxidoreductase